jgi:NTE family protein
LTGFPVHAALRATPPGGPEIGLALGGGGARGLAHLHVLEAFDDLGVTPSVIAGTSIGAMLGASYASGMRGAEVREYCTDLLCARSSFLRHFFSRWSGNLWDYWNPIAHSLFSAEKVMATVLPGLLPGTFEELPIPLLTVATDFYEQSQYVSLAGPLLPAIAASSALPALFRSVELDGRILIDGGFVNPLPHDLLAPLAGRVVAVDVSGGPAEARGGKPATLEAIIGAQQIALRAIIAQKLHAAAPDVLIRPDVTRFRVLDFLKLEDILEATAPAREDTKRALDRLLSSAAA